MKEKYLSLEEYSMSAENLCVYPTQQEAEKMFATYGFYGEVTIDRVFGTDNKVHLMWVCRAGQQILGFVPLFAEDLSYHPFEYVAAIPVRRMSLLEKNGLYFLICIKDDETAEVRLLTIFANQDLVETLCRFQNKQPKEIYPVKLTLIPSEKYVSSCWCVICDNPDEADGEICTMLPIDMMECKRIADIEFNRLNTAMISENSEFMVNNVRYRLKKDERGKWNLQKCEMQIASANDIVQENKKHTCFMRVIKRKKDI